jgi:Uma2 family endonuclease
MATQPSRGDKRPDPWSDPRLIAPTAEAWDAMSPAERDRAELRILDALDEYREVMSEGTTHSRPKINAYKDLWDHFGRSGRRVFLATELAVLYPGQPVIVPDLLAVMDPADPDRERESWRVQDEGRGIDLVLEFRNLGKKHKDLVENVREYAALGIAEYFSYDCRAKRLRGWRLSVAQPPGAGSYTQLVPQGGVYVSAVLGLELGVVDGRLRFFKDLAMIPSSDELVGRLQRMTDGYQDELAQVTDQLAQGRAAFARLLLQQLEQRGLALTEEQRARVQGCEDLTVLAAWMARVPTAATGDEVLA